MFWCSSRHFFSAPWRNLLHINFTSLLTFLSQYFILLSYSNIVYECLSVAIVFAVIMNIRPSLLLLVIINRFCSRKQHEQFLTSFDCLSSLKLHRNANLSFPRSFILYIYYTLGGYFTSFLLHSSMSWMRYISPQNFLDARFYFVGCQLLYRLWTRELI